MQQVLKQLADSFLYEMSHTQRDTETQRGRERERKREREGERDREKEREIQVPPPTNTDVDWSRAADPGDIIDAEKAAATSYRWIWSK
jgi:hypothetical protein